VGWKNTSELYMRFPCVERPARQRIQGATGTARARAQVAENAEKTAELITASGECTAIHGRWRVIKQLSLSAHLGSSARAQSQL
jgi:ABC-type protease/lipase transport system fused ATPase/permease subunit